MPWSHVRHPTRIPFIDNLRTVMDDSVHIKVKTVEFWNTVLCNELRYGRIPLTDPAECRRNSLKMDDMD